MYEITSGVILICSSKPNVYYMRNMYVKSNISQCSRLNEVKALICNYLQRTLWITIEIMSNVFSSTPITLLCVVLVSN